MHKHPFSLRSFGLGLAAAAALAVAGCTASSTQHARTPAHAQTTAMKADDTGPSGSRLWAQNCARCHNSRPSTDYSPQHWDVAMLHMRIRANLTAEEHRKIRAFLVGED